MSDQASNAAAESEDPDSQPQEVHRFKFRKGMDIGSVEAETDNEFLQEAFVNSGYLDTIAKIRDRHCVLVGRTGAGKSALLLRLKAQQQRVIWMNPEAMSLRFLSDSVVHNLKDEGVRLTLFYKLLWRHVIAVEVIQRHYKLYSEDDQRVWLPNLFEAFKKKDRRKEAALGYLQQWGGKFWMGTQERVKEIVSELEQQINAQIEGGVTALKASGGAGRRTLDTMTTEVIERSQKVVERIQIDKLDQVLQILGEDAFNDPGRPYYIVVDDLDKEWADDEFQYDLLDALLAEAQEFARRENVKLILALRENILEQLHRRTDGPKGRQREKQDALMLRIRWSADELVALLDKRLDVLIKKKYGGKITVSDLLPAGTKRRISGIDYLLQRTFMRPRDAIQLMNFCMEEAVGGEQITWDAITAAEPRYSRERARSLVDEWKETFPGIETLLRSVSGLADGFTLTGFPDSAIVELSTVADQTDDDTHDAKIVQAMAAGGLNPGEFVLGRLFRIGALGVKLPGKQRAVYSYVEPDVLDTGIPAGTEFYFHPALYEALNVVDPLFRMELDGRNPVELPGPTAGRTAN